MTVDATRRTSKPRRLERLPLVVCDVAPDVAIRHDCSLFLDYLRVRLDFDAHAPRHGTRPYQLARLGEGWPRRQRWHDVLGAPDADFDGSLRCIEPTWTAGAGVTAWPHWRRGKYELAGRRPLR